MARFFPWTGNGGRPVSVSSVSFHYVINEASLCGALQEAASNSAFRRENIADVFDGVSFVRVELEGRQRGDIPGPGLVQVECRSGGCETAREVSMTLFFLPITCASRPGFYP